VEVPWNEEKSSELHGSDFAGQAASRFLTKKTFLLQDEPVPILHYNSMIQSCQGSCSTKDIPASIEAKAHPSTNENLQELGRASVDSPYMLRIQQTQFTIMPHDITI
jgi:hypothetical protein